MDALNVSYRQLHENFMKNHNGTSVEETISIQSPIPFVIFLSTVILRYIEYGNEKYSNTSRIFLFLVEFFVVVVSQILILTVPNNAPYISYFIYAVVTYLVVSVILGYIKKTIAQKESFVSLRKTVIIGKRPYITYYRTSVNLTTTICILAVDFTSFPRKLAKTETFGYSLMDTGVGYFVVSSALVGSHKFKNESERDFLFKQLKQNSLLLLLGLSRILFTKSIDYQNHNTEYGVHWNFFLTLAFVRLLSSFILTFISINHVKYLAFFVTIFHQLILNFGVQDWVLSDTPRDTFINANREGIVSLLGYTGLYLVSVEIRNKLRCKITDIESDLKLLVQLIVSSILSYVLILLLQDFIPCSRRLVNTTYIIWIVMLTLYLLSFCLFFEIVLRLSSGPKKVKNNAMLVPVILESVNYNALPYFLLANVCTGIVNLCIETMYVTNLYSIFILVLYMLITCSITRFLYHKHYKLF